MTRLRRVRARSVATDRGLTACLTVTAFCVLAGWEAPAQGQGTWQPPFNWMGLLYPFANVNTVHVGVIPTGPQQGRVVFLTWTAPFGQPAGIYWGILDPEATPIANRFVHSSPVPTFPNRPPNHRSMEEGTCSGHSWTVDGRWFVAGGAIGDMGSDGAWLYEPDVVSLGGTSQVGEWYSQPAMAKKRYYPTVLLTQIDLPLAPQGELISAGGSIEGWPPPTEPYYYNNDYETFRPGPRVWFPTQPPPVGTWQTYGSPPQRLYPGPAPVPREFRWYPRLFLLPDGRMVNIGTEPRTTRALHPTSIPQNLWVDLGVRTIPTSRGYGTAVLFPNLDGTYQSTLVNFGGAWSGGATTNVEWANCASGTGSTWPFGHQWTDFFNDPTGGAASLPPMSFARKECCAVILPDATILVLHDGDQSPTSPRTPELLKDGQWIPMAQEASPRDHHSIALLLPSGRVLSGAGNNRTWDFQVFEPPYLAGGPTSRPAWGTLPTNVLLRGQTYTFPVGLPPGTVVGKVVLMRPGSLTHHADMDQRYVELPLTDDQEPFHVSFKAPDGPPGTGQLTAPLGYWMLFVLTNTGVPSVAKFVRFQ